MVFSLELSARTLNAVRSVTELIPLIRGGLVRARRLDTMREDEGDRILSPAASPA
jgi:hypothetical protein